MAVPVGTEGSTVIKQLRRRKGCLWETDEMLRAEKQRRVLSGPGFWVDRAVFSEGKNNGGDSSGH